MEELKNWIIDQLGYWNNYDFRTVCYGPSYQEIETKKKVFTQVLTKIREIENQECEKELGWHNINIEKPTDKQLGKHLLIRMKSITGNTEYDYLVYKYSGESITDLPDVVEWKEIK